jgi:anti-sigma B factor antagonist
MDSRAKQFFLTGARLKKRRFPLMDFILESAFDEDRRCWRTALTGEVDIFNSADMKARLLELIARQPADLLIDCRNLEYIDSTALGALVAVLKNVKSNGHEVRLTHVRQNLAKLFKITSLDKVFILEGGPNEN